MMKRDPEAPTRQRLRSWFSPALLVFCAACEPGPPPQSLDPAPLQTDALEEAAPEPAPLRTTAPLLTLPPLSDAEKGAEGANGGRRIGAHRRLTDPLPTESAWTGGEDGPGVWRIQVRSPRAVALRLRFTDFHVGEGQVLVYEAAAARRGSKRRYAGDGPAGDGEFWSDLIDGDTAIVEYQAGPDDSLPETVPFQIVEISHLWQSPLDAF